jgi:hypothetical protein
MALVITPVLGNRAVYEHVPATHIVLQVMALAVTAAWWVYETNGTNGTDGTNEIYQP